MARTTGGAARNIRRATPSAQEMLNSLGRQVFGDDFSGGPVAASKGEFNRITDVMYDDTQSMDYYNPKQYNNLAGTPMSMDTLYNATGGFSSRPFYEVVDLTGDLIVPGMEGPQSGEDTSPADLTVVPTSSTNPKRPRTVAAGYDEEEEKLTVVFRDGTFYNYYEVDENEWKTFKANRSKGAVIHSMLDFKPRGPADVSSVSKKAQEAFYRFSRGAQISANGKAAGQTKSTYKPYSERTSRTKQTGKNPSKGGKNPKGR
jgi:KTSC domain